MNELSPIDKLDSALNFICKSDFWITGNPEKYIYDNYNNKHPGIVEPEFMKILDKLVKDGYLDKSIGQANAYEYTLTFEGMVFNKERGYSRKYKKEATQRFLLSAEKVLIVFGVVAAGAYGLYELIKGIYCS